MPVNTSCGQGICASTGQWICNAGTFVNTCTPGTPQTEGPYGNATCSDALDNDCDGLTDAADPDCNLALCTWELATASAGWLGRYGHASVVQDGKIWVMGGIIGPEYPWNRRRNDVWYSTDGISWTEATASAPWLARDGLNAVVFNGKIWVLTGWSSYSPGTGGYERDVWYSTDGVNWTQATASAPWSGRDWASIVVFNNKIWILGGGNETGLLGDVWYSTDGTNWTLATNNPGWSKRQSAVALVYDDKIWIMGGSIAGGPANDVWYSTDGITWQQATSSADWSARSGHTAVVSNGKMWIMGGYSNSSYLNDVWYSTNGINWTQETASAGWAARSSSTALEHNGKIWILGGASSTYYNDVWYLTCQATCTDLDNDGYGNPGDPSCPNGSATDCDDNNPLEHPNQTWYQDVDGDGYSSGNMIVQCSRPVGYKAASELIATSGDCNDNNALIHPGATEICDGKDNDCNGQIDEGGTCDLIVSNLTAPANACAGANISIKDTTKNQGTGTAGESQTCFYFSTNTTIDAGDTKLGCRAIPSLAPATASPLTGKATTNVTLPNVSTGKYYLIAMADDGKVVTESNETNNKKSKVIYIGPDLDVISIVPSPLKPVAGQNVNITVTVKNIGCPAAGPFRVDFYKNLAKAPALYQAGDFNCSISGLTAGASATCTGSVSYSPTGTYKMWAQADTMQQVTEGNETNNKMSRSITVNP